MDHPLTDNQLIERYRQGDREAFNTLINRYGQTMYRFAWKLLHNSEEAHDVAQETFINAWKYLKRYDSSKSFKAWIFSIAHNKAIDILRKRKAISFSFLDNTETEEKFSDNIPDEQILQDEEFEKNENAELIRNALNSLSINARTIVLLHNGEEMTFEEIAGIIKKPMNTVKSIYRRALISLKKIISAPKS